MASEEESRKKRKGLMLFWIEAGVLVVVAIVLLVLLNYFQIIKLGGVLPYLDFLPKKVPQYLRTNANDPITVNSQRPDYSVTLKNPDDLLLYFSGFNIWQKAATELGQEKPFTKAVIVLTDQKELEHKYAYIEPYPMNFSYQVNAVDDTMTLLVYVDDSLLNSGRASELFGSVIVQILGLYTGQDLNIPPPTDETASNLFLLEKKEGVTKEVEIITPEPPKR